MFSRTKKQGGTSHKPIHTTCLPCNSFSLWRGTTSILLITLIALLALPIVPTHSATAQALSPSPTSCGRTVSELEACTFQLINSYRADGGLPPYLLDTRLTQGARSHSALWLTLGE